MNLPIPLLERILPIIFPCWNGSKGGSNTFTTLFAHEDCQLPTKDPQAFAVGRMLKIIASCILRMLQINGAKKDIRWYNNMNHYRNANNKRQSFHKVLMMISNALTREGGLFLTKCGSHQKLNAIIVRRIILFQMELFEQTG